jgi:hypothetical protein
MMTARSDIKAKKNLLSLLDRESLLLGEDSDVWHKPHQEPGDLSRIPKRVHLVWSMSVSKFARAERH